MVSVDFSRFVFLFGVAFAVLFLVCLFVLLSLSKGGGKRSSMFKAYLFFMGLFLLSLVFAYFFPDRVLGWIQ